jgi:hypothetical protein
VKYELMMLAQSWSSRVSVRVLDMWQDLSSGRQWLAVVGSGWQWSAVVGSGWQWSAPIVELTSYLAVSMMNPCPHYRAPRRAAVSATSDYSVAALTRSDDSVRLQPFSCFAKFQIRFTNDETHYLTGMATRGSSREIVNISLVHLLLVLRLNMHKWSSYILFGW